MIRVVIALLAALVVGLTPVASAQLVTSQNRDEPWRAYQDGLDALFEGDYQNAIDYLRIAHASQPTDPDVNFALGLAFFGAGDYQAARAPLERAVDRESAPASARHRLGITYLELGQRSQAIAQRDAIAADLARCGCDEYQQDRMQTALNQLSEAIDHQ